MSDVRAKILTPDFIRRQNTHAQCNSATKKIQAGYFQWQWYKIYVENIYTHPPGIPLLPLLEREVRYRARDVAILKGQRADDLVGDRD